jgi:SAM-dependent methyltransferase
MTSDAYTPGHTQNATDFMAKRSWDSHGAFFREYLRSGLRVLDCGCGPGSITRGIARQVSPAEVVGVDFGESQIERAKQDAIVQGLENIRFLTADCYSLPFEDETFDCVFSHALMEHLSKPKQALAEFFRVLRPGGRVGICSPDWGGFILAPPSSALTIAIDAYIALQSKNGGDVTVGRKLGAYLSECGFSSIEMRARHECYPSLAFIGEYLALQLQQNGYDREATTLRSWSKSSGGLFAQAWVSAVGKK